MKIADEKGAVRILWKLVGTEKYDAGYLELSFWGI